MIGIAMQLNTHQMALLIIFTRNIQSNKSKNKIKFNSSNSFQKIGFKAKDLIYRLLKAQFKLNSRSMQVKFKILQMNTLKTKLSLKVIEPQI